MGQTLMFVIDVAMKNTPATFSVQRKTEEDAKAVYNQVLEALRSGHPVLLELTCEQQKGKAVAVLVNEISAVQISEKGAASSSGKAPGFFSMAESAK